jgi:hypothetical protein
MGASEVTMAAERGLRLEFSDGRAPLTGVGDINAAMTGTGTGIWPLDLTGAPPDVRRLLGRPTLTEAEAVRARTHFLLPRERLLRIIEMAGRAPNVAGGGELTTFVSNLGYGYPQLWVVQGDQDYTRFDRFHVNVSEGGIGVDEIAQLLAGGGVVIRSRQRGGDILTLRVDCPGEDAGWLVTYNGGRPHMGSVSGATPGTKLMVQAIGPARWAVRYVDGG